MKGKLEVGERLDRKRRRKKERKRREERGREEEYNYWTSQLMRADWG